MTYGFLPFAILPLFVSIDRLDDSLVAAARPLRHRPLGLPPRDAPAHDAGRHAAALLTFIPSLGDFVTPDLLGGAQTTTIAKVVKNLFLSSRDWPYGAALGFVLIFLTIGGTVAALRPLRREVIG
jgi:spermidine/putrescine transport system permease protein